jgi:purine-nucleoside phosphorylase
MAGTSADPYQLADTAARQLLQILGVARVDVAFVLGSGWSAAAKNLGELVGACPLGELPGFARPVVVGQGGAVLAVRLGTGKTAAVLTGRTHLYEGRGVDAVVHGVRTAAAAGAGTLVLTNGCGGLNPDCPPGTPVLIRDHLNLTGTSPLRGPRFVDLTDLYSARLRALASGVEPSLPEGVYAQFRGPQYETPAEVRMAGLLGADLVGMSTALEAVAAREAGLEVLGISLVTNLAAGISPTPLSHAEVIEAGNAAAPRLRGLLSGLAAVL